MAIYIHIKVIHQIAPSAHAGLWVLSNDVLGKMQGAWACFIFVACSQQADCGIRACVHACNQFLGSKGRSPKRVPVSWV